MNNRDAGGTGSDPSNDPHDLKRFLLEQEADFDLALGQIRSGKKRSHWMWYIFPQIEGLGRSWTARQFAIKSLDEARSYLAHPQLGPRLEACAKALLPHKQFSVSDIFGDPDDLKLMSSMSLFAGISPPDSVFQQVLDQFFNGRHCGRTRQWLEEQGTDGD